MTFQQPQRPSAELVSAFAPSGTLRASINVGNPILANRDPATNEPVGVSIDLAREFAHWLNVDIELLVHEKAAASVETVKNEKADIGFFAIDPARSDGLLFTAPYVFIEGSYLVADSSAISDNADVDQQGHRISVGSGSAYDLFLTRHIKQAEIVRLQGARPALAALRNGQVEVAAGIRQVLEREAERAPGLRMLPGRFMMIEQAMATPTSRGVPAQRALAAFVERMKANGFVANALDHHRIEGAAVAPAS